MASNAKFPPRICVNLIVRDESHVILRLLENMRFNIDLLAVLDNGSKDDTIPKIRNYMNKNNIAGGVISRPWYYFGVTRTESLRYAEYMISKYDTVPKDRQYLFVPKGTKDVNINGTIIDVRRKNDVGLLELLPPTPNLTGAISFETYTQHKDEIQKTLSTADVTSKNVKRYDGKHFLSKHITQSKNSWYILFIDADNMLYPDGSQFGSGDRFLIDRSKLVADQYMIQTTSGGAMKFDSCFMIKMNPLREWYWDMPIHEFCGHNHKFPIVVDKIKGAYMFSGREGARNRDPLKYLNDALVLEKELIFRPENGRIKFYLGNSYKDAKKHMEAIRWYKMVIEDKNNWIEERYIAAMNVAQLYKENNKHWKIIKYHMIAHNTIPERREALFHVLRYYKDKGLFAMGFNLVKEILDKPAICTTLLDSSREIMFSLYDDASICAFYTNNIAHAEKYNKEILSLDNLNEGQRNHAMQNLQRVYQILKKN